MANSFHPTSRTWWSTVGEAVEFFLCWRLRYICIYLSTMAGFGVVDSEAPAQVPSMPAWWQWKRKPFPCDKCEHRRSAVGILVSRLVVCHPNLKVKLTLFLWFPPGFLFLVWMVLYSFLQGTEIVRAAANPLPSCLLQSPTRALRSGI